jgi:alkylation response protein AidB-like acyl-CoA dehydrogenase
MNFDPTDDQLMFRDTVARFCGPFDLAARKRARAMPGGFDRDRWRQLADLGLLALPASEGQGGIGGSLADCAAVAEALGYGVAVEPWLELCFWPLRLADNDTARAIVSGEILVAVAFAEPNGRYRLDPVDTRAAGDRLSGEKRFVLGGGAADRFLVTALAEDGPALFLVEQPDRRPYTVVDGSQAAELQLRNMMGSRSGSIIRSSRAKSRGAGTESEHAPLDHARDERNFTQAVTDTRLIAAAEMLGLAHRLFDETLAYVKQRTQFGQPLGRFQVIQHRLVDCYARLEQMRSTLQRALLDPTPHGIAGAKAFIAERALAIGHEAIQLHGGMGVTDELVVGHAHKRILLLSKLFGDPAADLATYAEAA